MVSQFGSTYSCSRLVYPDVKNFRIEVDAQAAPFHSSIVGLSLFRLRNQCTSTPPPARARPA